MWCNEYTIIKYTVFIGLILFIVYTTVCILYSANKFSYEISSVYTHSCTVFIPVCTVLYTGVCHTTVS